MIKNILIGGSMIAVSLALMLHMYFPIKTSALAIVEDFTDEQVVKPSYKDVETILQVNDNKWDGAVFYYSRLTDVSLNEFQVASLPGRRFCLSNEFERQKEILDFSTLIQEALAKPIVSGKANSSVYIPIVKALSFLKSTEAETKALLIYSDLMENGENISLYDQSSLKKMKENPGTLIDFYESKMTLPDLTGISVYLIYRPLNIKEDERFQIVSGFYKKMLENKGAKVFIQANI
ncbi:MAG: hypothetical protein EYC69_12095 [Bacteroidetes bacterium]|nr:MAG: hypothetical protein EYC69_12095 [Bacteroidota bacterium]